MGPPALCRRCSRHLVGEGSIALRVPECVHILGQSGGAAPRSDYLYKARGRPVAIGTTGYTVRTVSWAVPRHVSDPSVSSWLGVLRCCQLGRVDLGWDDPLLLFLLENLWKFQLVKFACEYNLSKKHLKTLIDCCITLISYRLMDLEHGNNHLSYEPWTLFQSEILHTYNE